MQIPGIMTQRFKDHYRAWMTKKKLDHDKAGALLGASRSASYCWAGGKTPPLSRLPLIAKVLRLDPDYLIRLVKREQETLGGEQ